MQLEKHPLLACVVLATATGASGCSFCYSLPSRPGSLDQLGVRVGAEWLQQATAHEDGRLGSVTHIANRTSAGETVVVGTRAALFLARKGGGTPRLVTFAEEAGQPELLEAPDGHLRYVDRGGGGWRTGAVIGADGVSLWRPEGGGGMDDLTGGDLDGDGVPEFVVGYNGSGGIRLLDAEGKERWRQDDGNVWHVEIVDTDADGKPEILHSNAAGQMTVRDGGGKILKRTQVEPYFSNFSLVQWPPQQIGVLHAVDDGVDVLDFDGKVRTHLKAPDLNSLSEASGTTARFDGDDYLVVAASYDGWDRSQLFVFDQGGGLRYREVIPGKCLAVATPEPGAFLFGCASRVIRYTTTRTRS